MRRSPLWNNRDFQILCIAQGLSRFGTQVSTIALPLLAARGSAGEAALVVSAGGLAQVVVLLPGGSLADRLHRRALAIICDAGCLLAMAAIGVAAVLGKPALVLLVAATSLTYGLGGVFYSTTSAVLRRVVTDAELPGAIAVNQARNSAAYLAGPFVGGLLFSLAPAAPFLVDALTFGLSLLGFVLIRAPLGRATATGPRQSVVRDISAGVIFLWRTVCLRWTLIVSSVMNCAFAGILFTVIVGGTGSPASGVSAGFIVGCAGAGSLIGSVFATRAKEWAAARTIVIATAAGCALLCGVLVADVGPVAQAVVLFACAALVPTMNVVIGSGQMLLTPDDLQGRRQAATSFFATCTYPLGPLLAGFLLVHGSPALAFLTFTLVLGGAAVLSAAHRSLRALPDVRSPRPTALSDATP